MKLATLLKWATVILMIIALGGGWGAPGVAWAQASTWHVAKTGSDVTGDGSEAKPFATIQHGINTASSGDTVLVHPGTYVESIDFTGKNIVVGSLFVTTGDPDYIQQTVINGNRNTHVVTFASGETSAARLSGFTITNGYAHGASSPAFHGNWTAGQGGGLNVSYYSHPHLVNSIVWGNWPEQIYFDTDWPGEAVTIEYSDIQGGQAGIVANGQGPVNWGDGNIDALPRFVNAGMGNYHLRNEQAGPCLGTGKTAGAPTADLEGNPRPRPVESNPDMGAFENPIGAWVYVPVLLKP
jgi:hypothetical protein